MHLFWGFIITGNQLQVLGLSPCHKFAKLSPDALSDAMLKYFKASSSNKACYSNNLALLVSELMLQLYT